MNELSQSTVDLLVAQGIDVEDVTRVVRTALEEDLRYGPDATTAATVGPSVVATASVVPRQAGVLAGGGVALAVLDIVLGAEGYEVMECAEDGDEVRPGSAVLAVSAPVAGLLTAERTMLNLLSHLSGVATATAEWVVQTTGTHCRIRDTRNTLPGLRQLQKYAVRAGGGVNHRMGLGDRSEEHTSEL